MAIELIKMDRRHRGINHFTHYANFVRHRNTRKAPKITGWPVGGYVTDQDVVKEFVECRNWCWEHFGPSCEVALYDQAVHAFAFGSEKSDPDWAWVEKEYGRRIYFKDETVAGMFSLMWCK
jgi:hypothetical protein